MRQVVFVLYHPEFGGPHNQALRLARPLEEKAWKMTVVLPEAAHESARRLISAGVTVVTAPLNRARASLDPGLFAKWLTNFKRDVDHLRGLIRGLGADIVLSCGMVNPQPALAARKAGVPLVWQIVDTRTPAFVRVPMMRVINRHAAVLMTTGMLVASQHLGARRFGRRLVPFFPPVDTELFAPNAQRRSAARRELRIAEDAFVIGNVSNINPQKGHLTFVRAAAALRRVRPETKFVILGAIYDHHAAYTNALWAEAEQLGLRIGEDLIVQNPGARVAELAPSFDIFWLTSEPRSEGLPTVVEEAMALGIPPVVSDVGSVKELVTHGQSGFVVPPRSPQAFLGATIAMIDGDDLRLRMSQAARRSAVSKVGVASSRDAHIRAFELAIQFTGAGKAPKTERRELPTPAGAGGPK